MFIRRRALSGFTLVEIVVSLVLLAILASGLVAVFVSEKSLINRSKKRLMAVEIARREIENRRYLIEGVNWTTTFAPTANWFTCNSSVYPNFTVECKIMPGPWGSTEADSRKFAVRVRWT